MLKKFLSLTAVMAVLLIAANALAANYIGNTRSKKFHYSHCSTIKNPNASHFVGFNSRDEAIAAGYVACKRCKP